MKHYIDSKEQIFAFESDGSQDHLIKPDMQPITQAEIAERNAPTPEEALAAERASMVVSPFQALQALDDLGYLAAAETAISGADKKSRRAWEKATEFRRTSPTVQNIAAAIGITDEQLDDLFRHAKTIEA